MSTINKLMKCFPLHTPIFVLPFSKHSEYKDRILEIIASDTPGPKVTASVYKSDYDGKVRSRSAYWDLIQAAVSQEVDQALAGFSWKCEIIGAWYQQYLKMDVHGWHTHPYCNISGVYYVELPFTTETVFIDPFTQKPTRFSVTEGDIILFPSFILHKSPVNRTADRKTVIAMNANFLSTRDQHE